MKFNEQNRTIRGKFKSCSKNNRSQHIRSLSCSHTHMCVNLNSQHFFFWFLLKENNKFIENRISIKTVIPQLFDFLRTTFYMFPNVKNLVLNPKITAYAKGWKLMFGFDVLLFVFAKLAENVVFFFFCLIQLLIINDTLDRLYKCFVSNSVQHHISI